jgi:regulator of CtrA degradation
LCYTILIVRFSNYTSITMQKNINTNIDPTAQNVLFMPSIYNDAMDLLMDAQEYFLEFGNDDQAVLDENLCSIYTREMSRITLRLSCVMSWLLAQRSVVSGKISPEDSVHYGLEFQEICRLDNKVLHGVLPSYVCHLLDSTFELYERVLRLDSQIAIHVH